MFDNTGNRGNDEEDMADEGDYHRDADGLVAAPVGVGNISAKKGDNITPKS